jgi:hypothetical protein
MSAKAESAAAILGANEADVTEHLKTFVDQLNDALGYGVITDAEAAAYAIEALNLAEGRVGHPLDLRDW